MKLSKGISTGIVLLGLATSLSAPAKFDFEARGAGLEGIASEVDFPVISLVDSVWNPYLLGEMAFPSYGVEYDAANTQVLANSVEIEDSFPKDVQAKKEFYLNPRSKRAFYLMKVQVRMTHLNLGFELPDTLYGIPKNERIILSSKEGLGLSDAVSHLGYKGPFQLGHATAIRYGGVIKEGRDDRTNPVTADSIASRILEEAGGIFRKRYLVLLRYLIGDGKTRRLRDELGTDDWGIMKQHLSPGTIDYIVDNAARVELSNEGHIPLEPIDELIHLSFKDTDSFSYQRN